MNCAFALTCLCVFIYMFVCLSVFVYVCLCLFLCMLYMLVCMCACLCIFVFMILDTNDMNDVSRMLSLHFIICLCLTVFKDIPRRRKPEFSTEENFREKGIWYHFSLLVEIIILITFLAHCRSYKICYLCWPVLWSIHTETLDILS